MLEVRYNKKNGFSVTTDHAITLDVLDIAEKTVKTTGEFLLKIAKSVTE